MNFTIIGSSGYIGSNLLLHLRGQGYSCFALSHNDPAVFSESLGNVIYCAGVTADFRKRPFDTVRANVSFLSDVLDSAHFDSFLYLSSTRIYWRCQNTLEDTIIPTKPSEPEELYNITKLAGEALCLNSGHKTVRIARLSNVLSVRPNSCNFFDSIVNEARQQKRIVLQTSFRSSKDYIGINDVVSILPEILLRGTYKIYNVAFGKNTTHYQMIQYLASHINFDVEVDNKAATICFPQIDISRLRDEFSFRAESIESAINKLFISKANGGN